MGTGMSCVAATTGFALTWLLAIASLPDRLRRAQKIRALTATKPTGTTIASSRLGLDSVAVTPSSKTARGVSGGAPGGGRSGGNGDPGGSDGGRSGDGGWNRGGGGKGSGKGEGGSGSKK